MSAPEPSRPVPPARRHPLTRDRIETMVSRAIVGFGLVFGVLVLPDLLAAQPHLVQPLGGLQAAALCLSLITAATAALLRRAVAAATAAFAVLYLVELVLWPVTDQRGDVDGTSWLWMLCTVAAAYATVALPAWLAGVYVFVSAGLFASVLCVVSDGADGRTALLDCVYSALVGCVILTIATMLRSSASRVDAAQRAALDNYEHGLREHLGEAERVEVDALVHDSVLTTLLAAAGARTPEAKQLAARMAADALGHLSSAAPVADASAEATTDGAALVASLHRSAGSLPHPAEVRTDGPPPPAVPSPVAEALHAASLQALLNSSQHAGGAEVHRRVTVTGLPDTDPPGVRIVIADDGAGFDLADVAPRRLGLATSIIHRMEVAGGAAHVASTKGAGTVITLTWPAPPRARERGEQRHDEVRA
ncbi:sensor histidine kinase [Gryllotalpicola ginsengisoli]|uniref:sensor histidine kinase n=1 Tax=Gryllotalpicola ginsengisoli TaxID=444608 RepID=UPI00041CA54F|nr:ATP-binding protein [Gryllotalpicola ginsengisoli]